MKHGKHKHHRHEEKAAKKVKKGKAKKALTAAAFVQAVADAAEVSKKEAKVFMGAMVGVIHEQLGKAGVVRIPQLVAVKLRDVPARPKCKKMIFGKLTKVPAKPACKKLRVTALKPLKDEVL